jgi:hypothetical protein
VPLTYQVLTATLSNVAIPLLAKDRTPAELEFASCNVTPDAGVIVIAVLLLTIVMTVPMSKATEALSGTVTPLVK